MNNERYDKEKVIHTYQRSLIGVKRRSDHVPEAIIWLSDKIQPSEFIFLVKNFIRTSQMPSEHIYDIARRYKLEGDWDNFKYFLDVVLESRDFKGKPGVDYAYTFEIALKDDIKWLVKYKEYCRNRADLTGYVFYRQETEARDAIIMKDHQRAAEIYQNIVNECGPAQKKYDYELAVCEQLLNAGSYESTIEKTYQ